MKEVFIKYWHCNNIGSHQWAATLHRHLQTMFLGLPCEKIKDLITSTDLNQVQCDTGTFRKVVHPLMSSKLFEHMQLNLFMINQMQIYANLVCICIKLCVCKPLKDKSAESIIDFCEDVFSTYRYLTILQTDNSSEFNNTSFKLWCGTNNILWRLSRAYKPTTQGVVERLNRTLKSAAHTDWTLTEKMTPAQFRDIVHCYNQSVHKSTGYTPMELMFGKREVHTPLGVRLTQDKLMEWFEHHDLFNKFKDTNPDIPDDWIRQNAISIASDNVDLYQTYERSSGNKVTIKPPLRYTQEEANLLYTAIGQNVFYPERIPDEEFEPQQAPVLREFVTEVVEGGQGKRVRLEKKVFDNSSGQKKKAKK